MSTKKRELIAITGTFTWARVFDHNKDTGEWYTDCDGCFMITVEPDMPSNKVLAKSGCSISPKMTEEGAITYTFKRKNKVFIKGNEIPDLGGAPSVVDADQNAWDSNVSIGNGSKGTVYIDVYPHSQGFGTRLVGVQVNELVEYNSDNSGTTGPKLPWE